jgi:hypothetical protein
MSIYDCQSSPCRVRLSQCIKQGIINVESDELMHEGRGMNRVCSFESTHKARDKKSIYGYLELKSFPKFASGISFMDG